MQVLFEAPESFLLKVIPTRVELNRGDKLGDYTIEKTLGSGTFGVVYKAFCNGQPYAIKLLKLWETVYEEKKNELGERFLREYKVGKMQSKYLVHSHTYGEIEGNPFFVMDFCPGGDLRSYIGSLKEDDMYMCGLDILNGLKVLHDEGIIHRDLKPENVMFSQHGRALLSDFGVSAFVNHTIKRMTRPNLFGNVRETFGTYAYIPPEQLIDAKKFKTTTPATDLWSFGVMIFELYNKGEYPWGPLETESDLADFIRNARTGKLAKPELLDKLPTPWPEVVRACLQPDISKRAGRVEDILRLLDKGSHFKSHASIDENSSLMIKILQGYEPGKVYMLNRNEGLIKKNHFSIGRSESNDVMIMDFPTVYISRNHATIEAIDALDGWYIRDGQWSDRERRWIPSTNGTFVNSDQVSKDGHKLRLGDIITIGDTTFKIMDQKEL